MMSVGNITYRWYVWLVQLAEALVGLFSGSNTGKMVVKL